jgi:P-type Cu+ transporter
MTCTMCSQAIERTVQAIPGIHSIAISLATDSALVSWRTNETATSVVETIRQGIEDVGYSVQRVLLREDPEGLSLVNENVEERWELLQQRQVDKVTAKRRAFFWSLLGTLPIFMLTMVLPHLSYTELCDKKIKIGRYQLQLEAVLLWGLATPVQFIAGWEFYRMVGSASG